MPATEQKRITPADLPDAPGLWFRDAETFAHVETLHNGRLAVGAWKGVCGSKYPTLGNMRLEELPRGGWFAAAVFTPAEEQSNG